MERYLFSSKWLSLEVVWSGGRAVRINLNPKKGNHASNPPEEVSSFFKQLESYLEGNRVNFKLPLDFSKASGFGIKVLEALGRTDCGETLSYAELAERAGYPKAARAVGRIMAKNPFPIVIPCHRVIGKKGGLAGFAGGIELKKRLLEHESGMTKRL